MIRLTNQEILRLDAVNSYSVEQLKEAFESLMKIRIRIRSDLEIYESDIGYVMNILSSIHEILTRSLENSEANGTDKGTELTEI